MPPVLMADSLAQYAEADTSGVVKAAWDIAHDVHKGFRRASGRPYVSHSIAVAEYLVSLDAPADVVAAAEAHAAGVRASWGHDPFDQLDDFRKFFPPFVRPRVLDRYLTSPLLDMRLGTIPVS